MKKNILVCVCILFLCLSSYGSSDNSSPALPISESLNSNPESENALPFWQKFLQFFGLSDKEKKKNETESNPKPYIDLDTTESIKDLENQPKLVDNMSFTENSADNSDKIPLDDKEEDIAIDELLVDLKLPEDDLSFTKITNSAQTKSDLDNKTPLNTKDSNDATSIPNKISKEDDDLNLTPSNSRNKEKEEKDIDNSFQSALLSLVPEENQKTEETFFELNENKNEKLDTKNLLTPIDLPRVNNKAEKNIEGTHIETYSKNLNDRTNKSSKLPKISARDFIQHNLQEDHAQIKFINNESQLLILPNDDVVLGQVIEQSKLDLMDFDSYAKIFWKYYHNIKNEYATQSINEFIDNYDSNFNVTPLYSSEKLSDLFADAVKAIKQNNIYDLINLLNLYPILQITDKQGNTLLHQAVYHDNYLAAKLLIMKGINLSAINHEKLAALDLATKNQNTDIKNLLKKAGKNSH